jgi:hypothetical protein
MYLASRARRWMWTCTNPTNYTSPTMTLVDHHAHRDLVSHGGPRRSIICDYTNAKGAINVANSTCHSGWLCSSLTPTLRLANAAPLSASTHLRALWSSACTCGVSLPSATSSKLLMHRSTPLVEKPRENLAFYRRDVVNHRTAVQRPTSRSSKLVSRRATPSQTRQL